MFKANMFINVALKLRLVRTLWNWARKLWRFPAFVFNMLCQSSFPVVTSVACVTHVSLYWCCKRNSFEHQFSSYTHLWERTWSILLSNKKKLEFYYFCIVVILFKIYYIVSLTTELFLLRCVIRKNYTNWFTNKELFCLWRLACVLYDINL